MALSFIKRVFTFGDVPPEQQVEDRAPAPITEADSVQAELEPKTRAEDLPVAAVDPVAAIEMETAGGPVSDAPADMSDVDEPVSNAEIENDAAILPGVEETSELGIVPLSLLEADFFEIGDDVREVGGGGGVRGGSGGGGGSRMDG